MGLPRIIYNSKNIDIPFAPRVLDPVGNVIGPRTQSVLGVVETAIFRTDLKIRAVWENMKIADYAPLYRNLQQWADWALAGNSWVYTDDRDKTAVSILATAAQGSTAPTKASGTAPANGDTCVIRHPIAREVVKVSTVAGSTYNLTESINSGVFADAITAGDVVKVFPELYWNARLLGPESPIRRDKTYFRLDINFVEDMNGFYS